MLFQITNYLQCMAHIPVLRKLYRWVTSIVHMENFAV